MTTADSDTIRLLLVDDEPLIRAGLRLILERVEGIELVAEAGDGRAAVQACRSLRPDVVLMDIRMPGMDGITATREITGQAGGSPAVVMLTAFDTEGFLVDALGAGAQGFLLKSTAPQVIVQAVRDAAAGGMTVSPTVLRRLAALAVRMGSLAPAQDPLAALSEREREIAESIGDGLSNSEIAGRLHLSLATVKTHVSRSLDKLGVSSRVQIALLAQQGRART